MVEGGTGYAETRITIGSVAELYDATTRRGFLRLVGLGATLVLLPSFVAGCKSDAATGTTNGQPGGGEPLLIDFALGDAAILQFAYVLEQLEADFYSRVVAAFGTSNIVAAEQALLTDIRNHEVAHREVLRATLAANATFTATPTFPGLNVADRASVLAAAKQIEDLGVAAYNGMAQYLVAPEMVLLVGKIVSVEARHAAAIRDLLNAKSPDFAPAATDDVVRPAKIAASLQQILVDKLAFANVPATFVQGPNNNG
jgi:hypothetical protein